MNIYSLSHSHTHKQTNKMLSSNQIKLEVTLQKQDLHQTRPNQGWVSLKVNLNTDVMKLMIFRGKLPTILSDNCRGCSHFDVM